jgi:hypothetical protein
LKKIFVLRNFRAQLKALQKATLKQAEKGCIGQISWFFRVRNDESIESASLFFVAGFNGFNSGLSGHFCLIDSGCFQLTVTKYNQVIPLSSGRKRQRRSLG